MSGTKVSNVLPTELIKQFEAMGEAMDGIVEDMLDAGVEAVKPTVEKNLKNSITGEYDTGDLERSMAVKAFKTKKGAVGKVIYFKGTSRKVKAKNGRIYKRKKAVRLDEVAAVLEYGKSDQPPRPFMRTAFAVKQSEITAAMEKTFDEKTRKYQN